MQKWELLIEVEEVFRIVGGIGQAIPSYRWLRRDRKIRLEDRCEPNLELARDRRDGRIGRIYDSLRGRRNYRRRSRRRDRLRRSRQRYRRCCCQQANLGSLQRRRRYRPARLIETAAVLKSIAAVVFVDWERMKEQLTDSSSGSRLLWVEWEVPEWRSRSPLSPEYWWWWE